MIFEKIKSGILVLLFTTCLLLAGQLLLDVKGSGSDQNFDRIAKTKTINVDTILYPQSCSISFGGGLYKRVFSTEVKQNLWQESRKYLKNYVDYLEISKITQGEWDAAVKAKAVRFVMPFSMSVNQLQSLMLEKEPVGSMSSILFDTLIVPINEDKKIYIGNLETGEHFVLNGVKRDVYLDSLMTQYESDSGLVDGKTIEELYAPSKQLAEEGKPFVPNQLLYPVSEIPNLPFVRVKDELEVSSLSEQALKTYVEKAFGSRNDFLKKIEDIDGSIVYLYGYGDRALRIGKDGVVTYKKRYEKQAGGEAYSFKEGVTVALGGLQSYGALPEGTYLSGYKEYKDKDGNPVKQFSFNYELEDLPLYLEEDANGQPMVVELTGRQVTGIKRKVSQYVSNFSVGEIWDKPMTILQLFEINYDVISNNFVKSDYTPPAGLGLAPEEDSNFPLMILQQIKLLDLIYYGNASKSESLVPAWHIQIGSYQYVVNMYSGEILKLIPPEEVK